MNTSQPNLTKNPTLIGSLVHELQHWKFSLKDKCNETHRLLKTEEQSTCSDDEAHGDVEHSSLRCHHHSAVAAKAIPAWE